MPDVFRFHGKRPPRHTAIQQIVERGISTHPSALSSIAGTSAKQGFGATLLSLPPRSVIEAPLPNGPDSPEPATSLYDRLYAAVLAQDIDQFIRIASDFYQAAALRKLSDLHPIGQAAYTLFSRLGPLPRKASVDRFLDRYAESDLVNYLQNDLPAEVTRVADTILAKEALRLHGARDRLVHTLLLKALYAVRAAHQLRSADRENWSIAPLSTFLGLQVFVPGWVWRLDPCAKLDSPGSGIDGTTGTGASSDLASSPLILKAKAVAAYREALTRPLKDELCTCTCDTRCRPQSPCCAHTKSFITDLMVVRETLHCYQPSDIAYIENVLAGEKRTRTHRTLQQITQQQQTETTVTSSEERDHQVSERFQLSSQVDKTIDEDLQVDAGVTFNQKWGAPLSSGSVTATLNTSFGTSTSTAEQVAQNYARDVVQRSVSKIEKSVRQLVSLTVLSETSETNKHVLDRVDKDLTVGIFTWVAKETKAQVFGYGRRMVYEMALPEPAQMYQALLSKAFGLDAQFSLSKPVEPVDPKDITAANYLTLSHSFGVDDAPAPPEPSKTLTQHFSGGDWPEKKHSFDAGYDYAGMHSQSLPISVPAGYAAISMSGSSGPTWNGHTNVASVVIHLGTPYLQWQKSGSNIPGPISLPSLEGQLQAVVDAYNVTSFSAQLIVECTVKPAVLEAWQSAVHQLLVAAYQKQKEAYDAALAAFEATQDQKKQAVQDAIRTRDPAFNREIERTELKRLAISMLSCQHFNQFNAMKRRVPPCGLPEMDLRRAEEEGELIQFWEQAFDWNLMTYLFYPYFWSPQCSWPEKIAQDTGDGLFDKFMQAGAARVQVPVAEGFEYYMLYWENTGQIWGQEGEPPVSDTDPHWISMIEEIKHQQDCYQNDREGLVETNPPSEVVSIKGSDRYWDPILAVVALDVVAMDLDREIVINAVIYRIVAIDLDANSPFFDPLRPNSMWWSVTLDRGYEGPAAQGLPYAVGAKFIGAPWLVTVPTNLVWLKNDKYCLPCYPLPDCTPH